MEGMRGGGLLCACMFLSNTRFVYGMLSFEGY